MLGIRRRNPELLKLLFLGDNGHHKPAERFIQLQPVLGQRGIDLTYTDKVDALNGKTLAGYDGLIIYANHTKITPEQEQALLDYVGGKRLYSAALCLLLFYRFQALCGSCWGTIQKP